MTDLIICTHSREGKTPSYRRINTIMFISTNLHATCGCMQNVHEISIKISSGCPRSGKKSGKKYFFKVRELSGNFKICQGILEFKQKSGKSQGILK